MKKNCSIIISLSQYHNRMEFDARELNLHKKLWAKIFLRTLSNNIWALCSHTHIVNKTHRIFDDRIQFFEIFYEYTSIVWIIVDFNSRISRKDKNIFHHKTTLTSNICRKFLKTERDLRVKIKNIFLLPPGKIFINNPCSFHYASTRLYFYHIQKYCLISMTPIRSFNIYS